MPQSEPGSCGKGKLPVVAEEGGCTRLAQWWRDFEWPVMGVLALVALVLGHVGYVQQFRGAILQYSFWDILYLDFQLFLLQLGNVQPPYNPALNVARFLAPAVAGYTALQALGELFADQLQSLRVRFLRRHIIICGLGRKGLILARGFLERGQAVVVIEQDEENDLVRQCRDLGAVVLIGDAAEPWLLRKVGLTRAGHLFALCGDDGVNAEVVVSAARLLARRDGPPLTCVVHIYDPHLCSLLRECDAGSAGRLRLEFYNIFDLGARVLLEDYPLFPECPTSKKDLTRMIIVGLGRLGESLVVHAARQWRAVRPSADARLHVTIIDLNASQIAGALCVRHPGLDNVCELVALDMDVHSASFQRAGFMEHSGLARVFVCLDDDSRSLSAALALLRGVRGQAPTVVVRMSQDAGLALLLRSVHVDSGSFKHLRAFGLMDRTCHPDQVLRGSYEILARAIHEEYLRLHRAAGDTPETNPSLVPWSQLPENLKESNRRQADHLRVKLKAVNCVLAPLADWNEPLWQFTLEEIERLARMEHERWVEERQSDGWKYGPEKHAAKRIHPRLKPYDDLAPAEKEKERNTVRQIPAFLARIGFSVIHLAQAEE